MGLATPARLSQEVLEMLRGYSWPGNVRELRNTIERAVLLRQGREILASHLPVEKMTRTLAVSEGDNPVPSPRGSVRRAATATAPRS